MKSLRTDKRGSVLPFRAPEVDERLWQYTYSNITQYSSDNCIEVVGGLLMPILLGCNGAYGNALRALHVELKAATLLVTVENMLC